jgi:tRNA(adenine34) deaminase
MSFALKEAYFAFKKGEIPIGSIITYKNKIIAKSYNLTEKLKNVTAHAEIQAINLASNYLKSKYLKKCTLYVTLEPCIMCAGALYWSQIKKVVFGCFSIKKNGFTNFCIKLHPKTTIIYGIMERESRFLLNYFFKKKRKNIHL